jgi:uncharacterized protein DUF4340
VVAQVPVNLRRILVLLVLVAALGVYLFVWEVPKAQQEKQKEKLVAVPADTVTGVTLAYPDRTIVLAKGEQGWRLTQPIDAPADDTMVKSLVTTVTEAQVQRALDQPPADLKPFGLDVPAVTVTLARKDGAPTTIAVGKNTPIGGRSYVKRGDDPKVYLTTTSLQFSLNKQPKDLRDKTLLAFQDDQVRRIEIAPADAPAVTLVQKDKDAWTVEPGDHAADATEVRSYLSSLRATRAIDFPADAPDAETRYGFARPRLTVGVTTRADGQETTSRLVIGGEAEVASQKQVYARVEGRDTVYALGDWSLKALGKSAGQFRDKTVLGFDPSRVGRLEIARHEGEGATLVRAAGGWSLEGSDAKPASDAVTRYLDDLRDLRGSDVAAEPAGDLARFGLADPALRVRLVDRQGQELGTILAARESGKHYAMRAGSDTVLEVRDYMYARLDKHRDDFVAQATPPGDGRGQVAPDAADEPPADTDADEPETDEE